MIVQTKFNVGDTFYANIMFEPISLKVHEVIIRLTDNKTKIAYITRNPLMNYDYIRIYDEFCFRTEEEATKNYIHNRRIYHKHDFTI